MARWGSGGWILLVVAAAIWSQTGREKEAVIQTPARSLAPATSTASLPTSLPTPPAPAPRPVLPAPPPPPALTAPPATLQSAPFVRTLFVHGNDVPMRREPNGKARILDRLKTGLSVEEVERRQAWVRIRHPVTAVEGWVFAARLTDKKPESEPQAETRPKELPQLKLPDSAVIAILLQQSLANYPGNCGCPDQRDRAGRRCGARSAYSRRGGYAPLCYADDVTSDMIAAYRRRSNR